MAWEVAAQGEAGERAPLMVRHRVVGEHTRALMVLGSNPSNAICCQTLAKLLYLLSASVFSSLKWDNHVNYLGRLLRH